MVKQTSKKRFKHVRASDLRGMGQLATQATMNVTRITEGVHQSVWNTLGMPGGKEPGRTRGITGLVYNSIYGVTQLLGSGVDKVLEKQQPWFDTLDKDKTETNERAAVLSALNGVMGDQLAELNNQLAIPMTFYHRQQALSWNDEEQALVIPQAKSKVLLMIHGLCMNDRQWCGEHEGIQIDHGDQLSSTLGYTPVYLRYNTGLHISQNGRELSELLEQLVDNWPAEIEELTIVAHSMGGLLTRSAIYYGQQRSMQWPNVIKSIVFLGTPHHGAPLERAGNKLGAILSAIPYTAPFNRLSNLRSSGITDLRYGYIVDEDWQGQARFGNHADERFGVPLPAEITCFTVAATTASQRSLLADRLIGDGLVPLHSALGIHKTENHHLLFADTSQKIFYGMNHMQLLSAPDVTRQLEEWLSD
jgi:pimeloyl-ACP methyl ester carboxylesterase